MCVVLKKRVTLGVNGCFFGSETIPKFPFGKVLWDHGLDDRFHSRSGNIACI